VSRIPALLGLACVVLSLSACGSTGTSSTKSSSARESAAQAEARVRQDVLAEVREIGDPNFGSPQVMVSCHQVGETTARCRAVLRSREAKVSLPAIRYLVRGLGTDEVSLQAEPSAISAYLRGDARLDCTSELASRPTPGPLVRCAKAGAPPSDVSDEDRIRRVVALFNRAVRRRDSNTICSQVIRQPPVPKAAEVIPRCIEVIARGMRQHPEDWRQLKQVDDIRVTGNAATAKATRRDERITLHFFRQGTHWRLQLFD
jgi:hypothetical protein